MRTLGLLYALSLTIIFPTHVFAATISSRPFNEDITFNLSDEHHEEMCGVLNTGYVYQKSTGIVDPFCWAVATDGKVKEVWIRIISSGAIFKWPIEEFSPDFQDKLTPIAPLDDDVDGEVIRT